ncbi:DUF4935 domain-containing protein [Actinoplanes sp. TBRC 11911]|uniref:PIN domain-containing protein n=1 Tax=Actinoplanes sp. TBRC 11911 TaxID=2729386 RepID=UPI00145ED1AE|nr:PIN domain-containing protein [Actinoplanes sp. TBRC 11911]NMO57743.1 DUF4935 domain-containing protein [Actinoplanes sp. TBRC 11911]
MADGDELRDLWDGFEIYGDVNSDEIGSVLREGIIALDTNILLHLYRCGANARSQIFDVLEEVKVNLFMPAQVQAEFWRKRDGVIREVITTSSLAGLREAQKKALAEIRSWRRRAMSTVEADELTRDLEQLFRRIFTSVSADDGSRGINLKAALSSAHDDAILQRLLALFKSRVGQPYDPAAFETHKRRGLERFEKRIPPGYMDSWKHGQVEEGLGDYLIWEQVIDYASVAGRDVLFVTDDEKEDWWRLDISGEPIAARVELIQEMQARAGVKLHMLRRQEFLEIAGALLDVTVDESTIDDVDPPSLTIDASDGVSLAWTPGRLKALLSRLAEVGASEQEAVIRFAAGPGNGFILRSKVYELTGRPESMLLVGFTKPVVNATNYLQEIGEIPAGIDTALESRYQRPGKAEGFAVPESVVESLKDLGEESSGS